MLFQKTTDLAYSSLFSPIQAGMAINGWWVIVIFLALVVVVALLILANRQTPAISPSAGHEHDHPADDQVPSAHDEKAEIAEIPLMDDLTGIEGIGPKIAALLGEQGINTFKELANAEVESIDRLLDEARLSFADPGSWPEQARLADLGEWGALDEFQSELKGGSKLS